MDLVFDCSPQGVEQKQKIGEILVDPAIEILANKLCTLLSRSEVRDLVDVRALERAGFSAESALALASRKDAGLTPAQLAWVLSQIEIGPDLVPPGNVPVKELRDYLGDLIVRLTQKALPTS